ncbi:MAG: hypothetical protein AAF191_03350 [Verrucomicrobiota bacterium]
MVLNAHPEIFVARGEVPLFERGDYSPEEAPKELEKLFAEAQIGQRLGLKRPSYLPKDYVAERLHDFAPQVKLIVSLRNPIERAMSCYYHNIKIRHRPIPARHHEVGM